MAARSVMDQVEELLAQRRLYEPAYEMVEKLWLSREREEDRERALLRMRDIARDNISSGRDAAAGQKWLSDAARALDVLQVKRSGWITSNIAPIGRSARTPKLPPASSQAGGGDSRFLAASQPTRPEPKLPEAPTQQTGRGRGRGRGRGTRPAEPHREDVPTVGSSRFLAATSQTAPPSYGAAPASRYPEAPSMEGPTTRFPPASSQPAPPVTMGRTRYPGEGDKSRPLKPRAFDSHFHLDRTIRAMRLPSDSGLQDLIDGTHVDFRKEVRLVGTCAVFCDPSTYPTQRNLRDFPEDMAIAAGFHPRHCATYPRAKMENGIAKLAELVRSPRIVGFGEIGLEHTEAMDTWHVQAAAIEKMLPFCERRHVLILHCRGIQGDSGAEAYLLLLHLVKKGVPRDQKIHLHCFTGDEYVRDRWLETFPNLHLGFTRLADSFNRQQAQALRGISLDRILLETDAPYFTSRGDRWSAPNQLYLVAESVAKHIDMPVETLLETTADNALRLYMGY